jgi:hypothetical protein
MKKFIGAAALALATIGATIALTGPAQAATVSGVPTTYTNGPVPKGHTIRAYVNNQGSKIISKSTALFTGGHRVRDMSPAPGVYTAKSTVKYQVKTTRWARVWVSDYDCADYSYEGYDDNGDGDYNDPYDAVPYDACAPGEMGYYDSQRHFVYGKTKKVVRSNQVRVQSDDSPGCATFSEYKAVRKGMTQQHVQKIVGAAGHISYKFLTPGYSHITREFSICNGDSYDSMDIEFYKYSPHGVFKEEDKGWYSY